MGSFFSEQLSWEQPVAIVQLWFLIVSAMASSEKFCLRWNDFETNISVAFRELREEKDFFDVTLACDDSQIQAHKVILSACSPFFRNVLRRNPHQHPLLYLKGVKYNELLSVLNFMYMGEVNVAQEELNSFLTVAEDLRVKGLTQSNSKEVSTCKTQHNKNIERIQEPTEKVPNTQSKRSLLASSNSISQHHLQPEPYPDDDIQEVVPVKSEPSDQVPVTMLTPVVEQEVFLSSNQNQVPSVTEDQHGTVALDESYANDSYDYGQYDTEGFGDTRVISVAGLVADANKAGGPDYQDVKSTLEQHMQKLSTDLFMCVICNYQARRRDHIRNHIEAKHMESGHSYQCDLCDQLCPTLNALYAHKSRKHRKKT